MRTEVPSGCHVVSAAVLFGPSAILEAIRSGELKLRCKTKLGFLSCLREVDRDVRLVMILRLGYGMTTNECLTHPKVLQAGIAWAEKIDQLYEAGLVFLGTDQVFMEKASQMFRRKKAILVH